MIHTEESAGCVRDKPTPQDMLINQADQSLLLMMITDIIDRTL